MYASTTHEFKEGVFVVQTFQKRCKKVLYFEKKLLQVLPSKIERNYANRINESSK